MHLKPLLSSPEVADLLGIAEQTLRNWRTEGRGPTPVKLARLVRYRVEDVEQWIRSNRVQVHS